MASVEEQILLATYPASTVYLAVQFMREKNHPPSPPPSLTSFTMKKCRWAVTDVLESENDRLGPELGFGDVM